MKTQAAVNDPADWKGSQIADGSGWLFTLSESDISALVAMADAIRERVGSDPDGLLTLTRSDVDAGAAQALIDQVQQTLKNGLGLALIRGFDVARISRASLAAIYWGIGLHLGRAQPNNPDGDLLGHVTDLGKTQADPKSRGYQTREAMDYHCDQCDIVGLLCVQPAKSGGLSKVASSVTLYNTLLQRHPEFAQALVNPLYWTKHGEHADDEAPYYTSPVFNFVSGQISTAFGPKHILKGHDIPGTPRLTHIQREAIARSEEIADEHHLAMELHPGDMQFLNNYTIVHTRTAYEDYTDPLKKRLLWRLWLMNDDLRPRTDYARQWQKGVNTGKAQNRIVL